MDNTRKLNDADDVQIVVRFHVNGAAEDDKNLAQVIKQWIDAIQEKYEDGTLSGNFKVEEVYAFGGKVV